LSKGKVVVIACLLWLFLSVTFAFVQRTMADSTPTSTFVINPAFERLGVNDSFTITVNLTNAQNLFSWQIVLKYNGTALNMTGLWVPDDNVFAGHEWNLLGPIVPFYVDAIDGSSSGVVAAYLLDGDVVTSVDSGVLCCANFTVINAGQSLVEIATESNPLHEYGSPWYSIWMNAPPGTYQLNEEDAVGSNCTVLTVSPLVGDVNGDLKVDIRDLQIVAVAFGSTPSSSNWNPYADVNGDGRVDIRDVALVAKKITEKQTDDLTFFCDIFIKENSVIMLTGCFLSEKSM